jgi:hypothetical protein
MDGGNGVRFGYREGLGGSEVSQYFELYLMVGIWVVGAEQAMVAFCHRNQRLHEIMGGNTEGNGRNCYCIRN